MEKSKPANKRGCLFYGGLTASVLLLMLLLGVLAGLSMAKKMRREFTDAQPVPLPSTQLSASAYNALQKRIDAFRESIKHGRDTAPLTVTAEEINALIANDPDFQSLKGKVHVGLEGGNSKGR